MNKAEQRSSLALERPITQGPELMGKPRRGSTVALAMVKPERLPLRPELVVEPRGGTHYSLSYREPERLHPRPELTSRAVLQRLRADLGRTSQGVRVGVSSWAAEDGNPA